MKYLTASHVVAPPLIEFNGVAYPIRELTKRDETELLATLGIYRHITPEGQAPLGYTPWVEQSDEHGIYYTREIAGTEEERAAAILAQSREMMSCSKLQARLAMIQLGLWGLYQTWLADPARTAQELAYADSDRWNRTSDVFVAAADELGWTEVQRDDFFTLANSL